MTAPLVLLDHIVKHMPHRILALGLGIEIAHWLIRGIGGRGVNRNIARTFGFGKARSGTSIARGRGELRPEPAPRSFSKAGTSL